MKEEPENMQEEMKEESEHEQKEVKEESEHAQKEVKEESEHAQEEMKEESENAQESMKSRWIRGAFVVFFLLAIRIAGMLVFAVAVFQFLHMLFAARANLKAQRFGKTLGFYLNETVQFVSYNVDTKPWPFTTWPSETEQPPLS